MMMMIIIIIIIITIIIMKYVQGNMFFRQADARDCSGGLNEYKCPC